MSTTKYALSAIAFVTALGASAPHLSAQSYTPMYAPQSSRNLYYTCVDQYNNGLPYAQIVSGPGVYLNTNAHFHDDVYHAMSSVTPTTQYADSGGNFTITLATSLVAQAEILFINCTYGPSTFYGSYNYAVGYNDVYYADAPSVWVKIGGSDTGGGTGHGTTAYNRYLKTAAGDGLYAATVSYISTHPGVSQICTNDMALPFGGKFDINRNWTSPHSQHDRGTAADVAGTGSAQCSNAGGSGVDVADFRLRCIAAGASTTYSFNEGDHAHCGFEAPTWPH
ncbi:MAG: hypothetical protein HYX27_06250 [Acidobacteria bacterium]|nr:hypothetical protein [Acidobacteriota bacterium]